MATLGLRRILLWMVALIIGLTGLALAQSQSASAADPGCTTTTAASWSAALPVETRSEAGESPCFTFTTTTAGTYLLRLSSEWQGSLWIADASGNIVASTYNYSDSLLPANLDAAKTYTIYVSPNQAGRYELGVFRLADLTGCAAVPSTAWDADEISLSFAASVSAVHCNQISATAGEVMSVYSEAHVAVFNKAGSRLCDGPYSGGVFNCKLSGTGPWQFLAFTDQETPDTASLSVRSFANDGGCKAVALAAWGEPLPVSGTRGSRLGDCYSFTSGVAGKYLLRMHQTVNSWGAGVVIYSALGEYVDEVSVSEQDRVVELKGGASYRLLVTGDPGGHNSEYRAGLFRVSDTTGCSSLSSTAWDADATTVSFADDPAAVHCRQITGTAGSTVRIGRSQSSYLNQAVFNKAGAEVCTAGYWSNEVIDCQLTGTGPWQLVTYENTYYQTTVPDSASFWVNSYATTAGCTPMALAKWGQNLPLSATRGDDLSDCITVTTGAAGRYLLRVSQPNWQWGSVFDVREATGVDVGSLAASSQSTMLDLKAAHTYKIIVSGNAAGHPGDFSAGLFRLGDVSGCDALASTAWDADATTVSFADDPATVHCRQVTGTSGSTVRISRTQGTYLTQNVLNKAGTVVCSAGYWTHEEYDCQLSGTGPWQVVTMEDTYSQSSVPDSASFWINSYSTTNGCTSVPLAKWGQNLPLAATRGDDINDCFTVSTGAAGKYSLRASQANWQWSLLFNVREASGADVGSLAATSQAMMLDLKASHTYKIIVSGNPQGRPGEFTAGLFRVADSAGCSALSSTAWDADATTVGFTDDPAAVHCRQVSATSGDRVRISRNQRYNLQQSVLNKGGTEVCAASYWTETTFDCQLTGTGPWQVVTYQNTYQQSSSVPDTASFWVSSYATTAGCETGLDSTASMISPRREVARTASPRTCLLSNLARNSRVRMDAQVQNRESAPWELIDANGDEQCRGDAFNSGIVNCDLRGKAPYRMLLGGSTDQVFEVAAHRITDAVGCHAVTSIASGMQAQIGDLTREANLQCFKFDGGAGDQLKFSAINPNVANNRYTVELFDPDGASLGVMSRWENDRTYALQQSGVHLALLSLNDAVPGRFELAAECLNPACGPDVLTVASVSPAAVGASSAVTVTLRGKGLTRTTVVTLSQSGVTIPGEVVALTEGGRGLDVLFDLSNRSGKWSLKVENPDGQNATLASALTVGAVKPADVQTSLVAMDRFVAGRPQTYNVVVENKGNVDALGVPVILGGLPPQTKVVPKFQMVERDPVTGAIVEVPFDTDTMLYSSAQQTMLPLFIGRMKAGERRQLSFEVTVTKPVDFSPELRSGSCFIEVSDGKGRARKFSATQCGIGVASFMAGFIPGYSCAMLVKDAVVNTYEALSETPDVASMATPLDIAGDSLGCAASFVPGGSIAARMLQVVGDGISSYQIADSCMPEQSTSEIRNVASMDPNEIVGPAGGGPNHAITGNGTQRYAVYFENAATATAPAQEVMVSNQLDPTKYDLSTLRFSSVQFGSTIYTPPADSVAIDHGLDLASANGLTVDIKASVTPAGLVKWSLRSLDPITGDLPQDPMIGFLPPNTDGSEGQGVLFYDVALKNPVNGSTVTNTASIVFDLNPAIATNTWSNLIDTVKPTVTMSSPAKASGPFTVSWAAQDAPSGVSDVTLYVAVDEADYTVWRKASGSGSDSYPAAAGHSYAFAAVATDWAGNTSALPSKPHTTTSTIADPEPPAPPVPPATPPAPQNPAPVTPPPNPQPVPSVPQAKGAQTVKAPPKSGKRGKKLKVSLKSSAGLPVAWRSASAKTCRVVGGALKLLKPGKCKVTATAAGTDQMLALTANYVIKVKK